MARPKKQRLDYFPLDVDYYLDPKIVAIRVSCGVKGELIIVRLLCEIYRNGYFVDWTSDLRDAIADGLRLGGPNAVDEVVTCAIRVGFFDKNIFKNCGVLTSKAIQERWLVAKRRCKGLDIHKHWLLEDVKIIDSNNGVNVYNNPENVSNNTHKVKESKVKDDYDYKKVGENAQVNGEGLAMPDYGIKWHSKAESLFFDTYCKLPNGELRDEYFPAFLDLFRDYDAKTVYESVVRSLDYKPRNPVEYVRATCAQIKTEKGR